ncbi:MAG: hypothetical protein SangKO_061290 [Sandaracinaceae bacterium]
MSERECPRMGGCPVFPVFKTRSALKTMQALYCEGDFSRCARFQSISKQVVPPKNLLPDGTRLRARKPTQA